MNTTGELRAELARCFMEAKKGELVGEALRGVIGCANQINASLAAEVKAREFARRAGETVSDLGGMKITA